MSIINDPVYLECVEAISSLHKLILERIEKEREARKLCKINYEIQTKLSEQRKIKNELTAQYEELSKKLEERKKFCDKYSSGAVISENDQNRLDLAKEMVEISKKLTGVRFDFRAPITEASGFIKSERHRSLERFKMDATGDVSDALWTSIQAIEDKENYVHNYN